MTQKRTSSNNTVITINVPKPKTINHKSEISETSKSKNKMETVGNV